MELAEKIRRIQDKLGKTCNVSQCGVGVPLPDPVIVDMGDQIMIYVHLDEDASQIQAGEHEKHAWEKAYFTVFGHMSFNDDPIEIQAQSIYDNWTRKGFKKDGKSEHPVEKALFYLNLVIMAPGADGSPSCFEKAKTLILAHCTVGKGAKQ